MAGLKKVAKLCGGLTASSNGKTGRYDADGNKTKPKSLAQCLRELMDHVVEYGGGSGQLFDECKASLAAHDERQKRKKPGPRGMTDARRKMIGLAKGTKEQVAQKYLVSPRTVTNCRAWVKNNL